MASVNLAACKIANVMLGWPMGKTLVVCGLINVFFAATAGLWGVLVIDLVQFGIAMTGSVSAAVFALKQPQVGGLSGLFQKLDPKTISILPDFGDWGLALSVLIIPIAVQWWSVWYPGAEPGGGSYIAQRMLAAKAEKDALGGTLFFNAAHYALRPWPWILVALCSIIIYPNLSDIQAAFPNVAPNLIDHDMAYSAMLKFLPAGLLGLMVAGLLAAYVSTLITHLNWGSSYVVHDFYRRFINKKADEKHYVTAGRILTVILMIMAGLLTLVLESAKASFDLMLSVGAGTGLIYLLRWFWWRINAWSEIAAMTSSFVVAVGFFIARKMGHPVAAHVSLLITIASTTCVWILVTFLTKPAERTKLAEFYKLVKPAGPGWKRVREEAGVGGSPDNIPNALLCWVVGCLFVYSGLFGAGSFLYGKTPQGFVWLVFFVASGAGLARLLPKLWTKGKKST
jgi:Na+/proline symporter